MCLNGYCIAPKSTLAFSCFGMLILVVSSLKISWDLVSGLLVAILPLIRVFLLRVSHVAFGNYYDGV